MLKKRAGFWLICYKREDQELTWLKFNFSGMHSNILEPNHTLCYGGLFLRNPIFLRLRNIPQDVRDMQEDFCVLYMTRFAAGAHRGIR